jgi:hypothetical protein
MPRPIQPVHVVNVVSRGTAMMGPAVTQLKVDAVSAVMVVGRILIRLFLG